LGGGREKALRNEITPVMKVEEVGEGFLQRLRGREHYTQRKLKGEIH